MAVRRRFTTRNAALALLTWLLVALVLHLKAERSERPSTATSPSIAHGLNATTAGIETASLVSKTTVAGSISNDDTGSGKRRTAVVVARLKWEDVTWLYEYFPQWEKNVYSVDDRRAKLTVPKNKGRESMAYLSYIIENYDHLPDIVFFLHSNRYQWHNDDPDYDGVPMLRRFQMPYLEQEGYVNIRCTWQLGCPHEIAPLAEEGEHRAGVHAGTHYKQAFEVLFPEQEVPEYVGVSCCAQFAATKEKIRERKKSEYLRYRKWLLDTELPDSISGRVMEYSWHMIFGNPPVHCPSAEECYCKVFSLCNVDCDEQGICQDRYTLPPFSTLPEGWPYIGWDQEERGRAGAEE